MDPVLVALAVEYTHQSIVTGLPVRLMNEERGRVMYEVPWSVWPRVLDSTNFHRFYVPIEEIPA